MDESGKTRILKISSHTCGCIGFRLSSLLSVIVMVFSNFFLLVAQIDYHFFPFRLIDAFKLFLSRIFCLFFFVLFVVLVEIKQCLNFQCWTIKIIKNSGVLFYFLFHEKTIFCDQFSYFDKVCNDEEKFIVFNCFFIRIYLERKKKNHCDYFLVFTCSLIRV